MFHKIYIKPEAFEENLLKMKEVRSNKILFRDAEKLKFHKIPKIREIFILSKEESKRDYSRFVKIKLMQRKIRHVNLTGSCLQDFSKPCAPKFRLWTSETYTDRRKLKTSNPKGANWICYCQVKALLDMFNMDYIRFMLGGQILMSHKVWNIQYVQKYRAYFPSMESNWS